MKKKCVECNCHVQYLIKKRTEDVCTDVSDRGFMTLMLCRFSTDSVEDELELSAVRHRPEGLEQLEAQTRFSRKELQILYRGFKNVS